MLDFFRKVDNVAPRPVAASGPVAAPGQVPLKQYPRLWDRLMVAWVGFFGAMGVVNLAVAFSVSTEVWVTFKLFGLFGLTLAFMLGLGIYLSRHLKEEPTDA